VLTAVKTLEARVFALTETGAELRGDADLSTTSASSTTRSRPCSTRPSGAADRSSLSLSRRSSRACRAGSSRSSTSTATCSCVLVSGEDREESRRARFVHGDEATSFLVHNGEVIAGDPLDGDRIEPGPIVAGERKDDWRRLREGLPGARKKLCSTRSHLGRTSVASLEAVNAMNDLAHYAPRSAPRNHLLH